MTTPSSAPLIMPHTDKGVSIPIKNGILPDRQNNLSLMNLNSKPLGTGERQVDGASGYEVIPGTDSTAEGTTNVHSASKETSSGDSETDLNDSVLQEQELIAN